jgi:hypothetical protein
MAITRPTAKPRTVDDFVARAPDAGAATQKGILGGVRKGKKRQISLTITDHLLERADRLATHKSVSRAGAVAWALDVGLKAEGF